MSGGREIHRGDAEEQAHRGDAEDAEKTQKEGERNGDAASFKKLAASPFVSPAGVLRWFLNAYVQLAIGALLVTTSELLLKRGAVAAPPAHGPAAWTGISALASGWTWLGIVSYILSFISWIHVLRTLPLSIAFPAINIVHILVPLGAWLFLREAIPARRWLGILLVIAGIVLIVKPVAKAEAKL